MPFAELKVSASKSELAAVPHSFPMSQREKKRKKLILVFRLHLPSSYQTKIINILLVI